MNKTWKHIKPWSISELQLLHSLNAKTVTNMTKRCYWPPWLMTFLYGSMAFMSTLCSWSPMRNTLQRRPSSLSSETEYSWTDSTPFCSSSVVFGLGRSSKKKEKEKKEEVYNPWRRGTPDDVESRPVWSTLRMHLSSLDILHSIGGQHAFSPNQHQQSHLHSDTRGHCVSDLYISGGRGVGGNPAIVLGHGCGDTALWSLPVDLQASVPTRMCQNDRVCVCQACNKQNQNTKWTVKSTSLDLFWKHLKLKITSNQL